MCETGSFVSSAGLHFWWLNFPRLHSGARCMPVLIHRKWWEHAARRRGGVGGITRVHDSWLLDGLRVVRCWQDTETASAVGCGKRFPSISSSFIGWYWRFDFCLDFCLFCILDILYYVFISLHTDSLQVIYIYATSAQIFWYNRSVTVSSLCN